MAKKQKRIATNTTARAKKPPRLTGAKPAKSKAGAIVLTTLAIGAAGVLTYLGWQYLKKRKAKKNAGLDETLLKNQSGSYAPADSTLPPRTEIDMLPAVPGGITIPDSISKNPPVMLPKTGGGSKGKAATGEDFPLKRGSKGDNVRALQEALIKKYGAKVLPRYGADGSFGAEMTAALKKLKMPATISETFFNVLTQGGSSTTDSGGNLSGLAIKLYNATMRRDFSGVRSLLQQIKSSDDYATVSNEFKQYRIGGVRQTLVNGLLNVFSAASQQQQLRLAFAQMGLVYDGNKWSLSGIGGIPIVTTVPAKIWVNANTAVRVPARMVLGHEVARRLQYVLFSNNGRHFLVHADCIKQL